VQIKPIIVALALGGVVFVVGASGAAAQLQITPSIGMYIPHGAPVLEEPASSQGLGLRKVPVGGALFATRLQKTMAPHVTVEASLIYSPNLIAVRSQQGTVSDVRAALVMGSLKSVFELMSGDEGTFSLHVGSGVGYVHRTGKAWADTPVTPAFALVGSGGVRAKLDPRSPLVLSFEAEDYISWTHFRITGPLPAHLYNDVIVSLGLAIPVGRQR
jgi:hypothetical protein